MNDAIITSMLLILVVPLILIMIRAQMMAFKAMQYISKNKKYSLQTQLRFWNLVNKYNEIKDAELKKMLINFRMWFFAALIYVPAVFVLLFLALIVFE